MVSSESYFVLYYSLHYHTGTTHWLRSKIHGWLVSAPTSAMLKCNELNDVKSMISLKCIGGIEDL